MMGMAANQMLADMIEKLSQSIKNKKIAKEQKNTKENESNKADNSKNNKGTV